MSAHRAETRRIDVIFEHDEHLDPFKVDEHRNRLRLNRTPPGKMGLLLYHSRE